MQNHGATGDANDDNPHFGQCGASYGAAGGYGQEPCLIGLYVIDRTKPETTASVANDNAKLLAVPMHTSVDDVMALLAPKGSNRDIKVRFVDSTESRLKYETSLVALARRGCWLELERARGH